MSDAPSYAGLGAERRGELIRMPIFFQPDVFELLRLRAQREGSCVGDVVNEMVVEALGG